MSKNAYKKGHFLYVGRNNLANTSFRVQAHKFSQDNIQTTLVCSKCDEVFSKEFPLDLEGQTIEFKCPVCGLPRMAHKEATLSVYFCSMCQKVESHVTFIPEKKTEKSEGPEDMLSELY